VVVRNARRAGHDDADGRARGRRRSEVPNELVGCTDDTRDQPNFSSTWSALRGPIPRPPTCAPAPTPSTRARHTWLNACYCFSMERAANF